MVESEEIIRGFTRYVIFNNIDYFLPYIFLENVKTSMKSKNDFLAFVEKQLEWKWSISEGQWYLIKEKSDIIENENYCSYDFYDEKHTYSRFSMLIKVENNIVYFEALPF